MCAESLLWLGCTVRLVVKEAVADLVGVSKDRAGTWPATRAMAQAEPCTILYARIRVRQLCGLWSAAVPPPHLPSCC